MEIVFNADIEVTARDSAGQLEKFVAHMTERSNPWTVGSERAYKLDGRIVSGVIEAIYMDRPDAVSAPEMDAIARGLTLRGAKHHSWTR